MRFLLPLPTDGKMHRYCFKCMADGAEQVKQGGKTRYYCQSCGKHDDRAFYFSEHKAWVDEDNTLWHESAVVFVRRQDGKFLFFLRNEYPVKLTVPSGHVDHGENPETAAKRELKEETGLVGKLEFLGQSEVRGDSCSAGADDHDCGTFLLELKDNSQQARILEEGHEPLWLSLKEAQEQGMTVLTERLSRLYKQLLSNN